MIKCQKFLIYKHINGENKVKVIFDDNEMAAIDGCEKNPYIQDYDIVEANSSQEALEKAKTRLREGMQAPPDY